MKIISREKKINISIMDSFIASKHIGFKVILELQGGRYRGELSLPGKTHGGLDQGSGGGDMGKDKTGCID